MYICILQSHYGPADGKTTNPYNLLCGGTECLSPTAGSHSAFPPHNIREATRLSNWLCQSVKVQCSQLYYVLFGVKGTMPFALYIVLILCLKKLPRPSSSLYSMLVLCLWKIYTQICYFTLCLCHLQISTATIEVTAQYTDGL